MKAARSLDTKSLSSLSESEDDCRETAENSIIRVVLSFSKHITFLEMQPWRLCESSKTNERARVTTLQESASQTAFVETVVEDAEVQLAKLELKDVGTQADVGEQCFSISYDESAEERLLEHLSLERHKHQLLQWHSPTPKRSLQFFISPISKYASKVLAVEYNASHKLFALLCGDEEFTLELWSLSNLLRAKRRSFEVSVLESVARLALSEKAFAVSCGAAIIVEELFTTTRLFRLDSDSDVQCLKLSDASLMWITSSGALWRQSLKMGYVQKLLLGIPPPFGSTLVYASFASESAHLLTSRCLLHVPLQNPYDFDFLVAKNKFTAGDRLIPLGSRRFVVFFALQLLAQIWLYSEPRAASHELQFTREEPVVDFGWHNSHLYSLTTNGEISKWKLLENRRKQRVSTCSTRVTNCARLISISENKFVVQCATRLAFIVNSSE